MTIEAPSVVLTEHSALATLVELRTKDIELQKHRIQTQTYKHTLDTEPEFRLVVLTVHSASTPFASEPHIQNTTTYTEHIEQAERGPISCNNTEHFLILHTALADHTVQSVPMSRPWKELCLSI